MSNVNSLHLVNNDLDAIENKVDDDDEVDDYDEGEEEEDDDDEGEIQKEQEEVDDDDGDVDDTVDEKMETNADMKKPDRRKRQLKSAPLRMKRARTLKTTKNSLRTNRRGKHSK